MTGEPHASGRVFVYGTLMPGEHNAAVAGTPLHATGATLAGFALYDLDPEGYPAIVEADVSSLVRGVVLTFTPHAWTETLARLDRLEGLDERPPLYVRTAVQVRTDRAELVSAWVYVYGRPDRLRGEGARLVPGGDWRSVRSRSRLPARH